MFIIYQPISYPMVSNKTKLAQIEEWSREIVRRQSAVLVEGIADKEALELLEIERIYHLNKQPLYVIVEELSSAYTEVILLLDLDTEGEKLCAKLRSDFIASGVRIITSPREWLRKNTSIKQIEDIKGYLLNLRKEVIGSEL